MSVVYFLFVRLSFPRTLELPCLSKARQKQQQQQQQQQKPANNLVDPHAPPRTLRMVAPSGFELVAIGINCCLIAGVSIGNLTPEGRALLEGGFRDISQTQSTGDA